MPTAQILTIGDELLSGDTVNTNLAFLGERCRRLGVEVVRALSVRDRIDEIVPPGVTLNPEADNMSFSTALEPANRRR